MDVQAPFHHIYRPADFYLLRVPALPASLFPGSTAFSQRSPLECDDLSAVLQAQRAQSYQQLRQLAAQPSIALALATASSSLEEGLARLSSEADFSHRSLRILASLLRYVIRMSTRPTPFGLFSGVAVGTFADQTSLLLAHPPLQHTRVRPDMVWMHNLLQRLENTPALVEQLRFRAHPGIYQAGERFILQTYGQRESRSVALKATSAVRRALELACEPLTYQQFCEAFRRETTENVPLAAIQKLFWRLWNNHFLLSDLHPPLTQARPATALSALLMPLQGTQEISQQLRLVLDRLREFEVLGTRAPLYALHDLSQSQVALTPGIEQEQPLMQIDAAVQLRSSQLHRSIGAAAAFAAEILLRLSPAPDGRRPLAEYRKLFLERYGEHAEVPLLELLSAEHGLDAPPGYELPPRSSRLSPALPPLETRKRDRVLQKLVAAALNTHSLEIELTEPLLGQLEEWSPRLTHAPYSLEICLQIHAQSCQALDRGEWRAVIGHSYGSMSAGRTFGRFFDLFGTEEITALQQLIVQEETLNPSAIFAELTYRPRQAREANITIRPLFRSYEIGTDATPSLEQEQVIPLHDLVVGVKHGRFYLRSSRLQKQVIICQGHMLNAKYASNIYRFLSELAYDGRPLLDSFFWGNSWYSPFLPRVFVRFTSSASIVLSPAQWFVEADSIVPEGDHDEDEETRWFRGVQHWRTQWRVPRYVYLTEPETRLLLDLEHPLMTAELRSALTKRPAGARIQLQEVLPDFAGLWLHDEQNERYFSEIVVPLLRSDASPAGKSPASPQPEKQQASTSLLYQDRCVFPGEDWLFFKLYAPYKQHNKLIASHIKGIAEELLERGWIDTWFFVRYADPEPHIRLRFHTKAAHTFASLLAALMQWSCQLARQGVIQRYSIDTYLRELERYGGPVAIDLLEHIFSLDSTMICQLLAAQQLQQVPLDPHLLAVWTLDRFVESWGWDLPQRLHWLEGRVKPYEASQAFHPMRRMYMDFLAFEKPQTDAYLAAQRVLLLELLQPQEQLLTQLSDQIHTLMANQSLCVSEEELVTSLLHMHCNRLGISRSSEHQISAFWYHTLKAIRSRAEQRNR